MKFSIIISDAKAVYELYKETGIQHAETVRKVIIDADVVVLETEVIRSIDIEYEEPVEQPIPDSTKPIAVTEFKTGDDGKPILEPCPKCNDTNIIFVPIAQTWEGRCNKCGYILPNQEQTSEISAMIFWNINAQKEKKDA